MTTDIIEKIKKNRPIVHCITNPVTVNDCANALLAIGASPTMAHHIAEVEEITSGCQALVCNLGATDDYDAMLLAAKCAAGLGHPIIVDPVGISGSTFRRNMLFLLLQECHISCVRGNYSEIRSLIDNCNRGTGVDASPKDQAPDQDFQQKMLDFAARNDLILAASGKVDLITDGKKITTIAGGHELMSKITGTGCMSTALLGAVFAVDNSIDGACFLSSYMKRCGMLAATEAISVGGGTMTFRQKLIDKIGSHL